MSVAAPAAGTVLAEVAGRVEALTRFDAADLHPVGAEQVQPIDVVLDQQQVLHFEIVRRSGAGRLSADVEHCRNETETQQALMAEQAALLAEAPAALEAWVDRDDGRYRRLLPAEAGLARPSKRFGHEQRCGSCCGQGQTACSTCSGKGRHGCNNCGASGRERCTSCGGGGMRACGGCGGRGQWTEYVTEQRWDPQQNANVTWSRNEWRQCSTCGGGGRQRCGGCSGSGTLVCRGCGGAGQINCRSCGATGRRDCAPCAASGTVHEAGEVQPRVTLTEGLSAAKADADVAALLPRLSIEGLPALGSRRYHAQVLGESGTRVHARYAVQVAVHRLALRCRGRDYVIHGFGPAPLVPDHGDLVAHLLQDDLLALEAALAGRGSGELATAASRFAASELNLTIVEQVAGGSPRAAAALTHEGLVDADYLQRAGVALAQAVKRLQGSLLRKPFWGLLPMLAVLSAGLYVALGPEPLGWQAVLVLLGLALAGWFGVEWWARRSLRRLFPDGAGARLLQASQSRSASRRRQVMTLGSLAAAAVVSPIAAAMLPPVRQLHFQREQTLITESQILTWRHQPRRPDLRLRQPLDAELLQQRQSARSGAVRRMARSIAGWQQMPSARGGPADLAQAAVLFKAAEMDAEPLAQIGRAALVALRAESTLAELQQAAALLQAGASVAPLEAGYWQAQLLLHAAAAPVRRASGLSLLAQVANAGHGHAALEMARRHRQGDGLPRDAARAQRYQQIARGAGITPAR